MDRGSLPTNDFQGNGKPILVGILSIQGAFAEHAYNLRQAFELLDKDAQGVLQPQNLSCYALHSISH